MLGGAYNPHFILLLLLLFLFCHVAYRILVPRPGVEPMPPALEARSLNHWTAREVPYNPHFWWGWVSESLSHLRGVTSSGLSDPSRLPTNHNACGPSSGCQTWRCRQWEAPWGFQLPFVSDLTWPRPEVAKWRSVGQIWSATDWVSPGPHVLVPTVHQNLIWLWDFPGGAVVGNPPANAGDTNLSPGPGRSHMPRSN